MYWLIGSIGTAGIICALVAALAQRKYIMMIALAVFLLTFGSLWLLPIKA